MLDRVVVIDNREDEIKNLVEKLEKFDISVDKFVVDDDTSLPILTKNRQLFFIDLMLDENVDHINTNISWVISILNKVIGDGFGPYGLVIWTKHANYMDKVRERFTKAVQSSDKEKKSNLHEDEVDFECKLDNPPLFIISIDKTQFKSTGVWDYSNLMDILNDNIQKSNISYFFLRWLSVIREASQKTISSIYGLSLDYKEKEEEVCDILCRLALNQIGKHQLHSGLTSDTYKAFSSIVYPKINSLTASEKLPSYSELESKLKNGKELSVIAKLNSILFIDSVGINQNDIVPGNIYQIMDNNNPAIVKVEHRIEFTKKNDKNKYDKYKNYECIPIAIELTPPCDFSNKKIMSRIVGGYIVNCSANQAKKKIYKKISGGDKCYVLQPIYVPGDDENIKYIIFDFRYLYTPKDEDLKDATIYKVLFRANHSLFSDILQKFSSHAARLGLSNLELEDE